VRVVSLPGDPGIGPRLADLLGLEYIQFLHKKFPDGEIYLRLPKVIENEGVLLVQSMYPNQNDHTVELLLALELLSRYRNNITLLITYLAYARQDKEFLAGEPVSLRSLVKALSSLGLGTLVTIDAHSPLALREFLGTSRYINIVPDEVFAEAISRRYRREELTVIAPDQGAEKRAASLAELLGCRYVVVKKARDRITGNVTHVLDPLDSVSGIAVVVDDIVSTGGTIAGIASYLSSRGVRVVVAASHALFVGDAYDKLARSGVVEIYALPTTGVTVSGVTYLDMVPYIARKLREEKVVE
jgi:ribose-phosphate pyrophosphokinase